MPTPTYDLIASQVLSTSAASVSFTSIPATYRDLVLVCDLSVASLSNPVLQFNGDTGSNYNYVYMYGDGSTAVSGATTNTFIILSNMGLESSAQLSVAQIMDYSATDKHKAILIRSNQQGTYPVVNASANRWANTAAITSLTVTGNSANLSAGSTFYLYGIAS